MKQVRGYYSQETTGYIATHTKINLTSPDGTGTGKRLPLLGNRWSSCRSHRSTSPKVMEQERAYSRAASHLPIHAEINFTSRDVTGSG